MASGYEKHPDYGGPEPSRTGIIFIIVFVVLVTGLYLYLGR